MMDTVQLLCEISLLRQKMNKAEAFLEELVEYLLVTCKDDDYITPEVICRKLAKYGYIELEDGYWVNPLADRKTEPAYNPTAAVNNWGNPPINPYIPNEQTEPQTEREDE